MMLPPNCEQELDELLSRPSPQLIDVFASLPGDLIVLGASGKMGPSLAHMAKRASDAAGLPRRIIGVARFMSGGREQLLAHGIETIECDLLDEAQVMRLPEAANVIFMAGRKFGSTADEPLTWAMNAWLPTIICRRYRTSRIVAFSTGNVYGLVPVASGGSRESDPLKPVGEYAMSCLVRERLLEYFSRAHGIPMAMIRLNYACDLRYGVLVDLAHKIMYGEPIDLSMGYFNTIWQADANDFALRALACTTSPPRLLNVTGSEILSVKTVCQRLCQLLDRPVHFAGVESPTALLSNPTRTINDFGPTRLSAEQLIEWVAHWLTHDGRTLDKPTHFESRSGDF